MISLLQQLRLAGLRFNDQQTMQARKRKLVVQQPDRFFINIPLPENLFLQKGFVEMESLFVESFCNRAEYAVGIARWAK